jgi:hypothetical protein
MVVEVPAVTEEAVDHQKVVRLRLILPSLRDSLPALVLWHQIQDLVAVEVVVVAVAVVADSPVRPCLQVLQVLLVPKALQG